MPYRLKFDRWIDLRNAVVSFVLRSKENKKEVDTSKISLKGDTASGFFLDHSDEETKKDWLGFCLDPSNGVRIHHDPES